MEIRLHLGLPGQGKTFFMLKRIIQSGKQACIYTPPDEKKKDELSRLPFVLDTPEEIGRGLQRYFQQSKIFCVHYNGGTENFFNFFDLHDCWLVLDDYPTLCGDISENRLLKRVLPLLRRANVNVYVTAHCIEDDIPRKLRKMTGEILQFGPCTDPDEQRVLLGLRQGEALGFTKKEFRERLNNIEKQEYLKIR